LTLYNLTLRMVFKQSFKQTQGLMRVISKLMCHWKAVVGHKLKARSFDNQKNEAKLGVRILNQMTAVGRPSFQRTD
jgi:hypothetical protein